jgi:hypothetical protein
MNYDFDTEAELIAAAQGEYGVEAQAHALGLLGVEVEVEGDEDYDDGLNERLDDLEGRLAPAEEWEEAPEPTVGDEQWQAEFNGQIGRLEKRIGRELSTSEVQAIAEDTFSLDHIPDLAEKHADQLRGRVGDDDDRHQLMAEFMDEADFFADMEAGQQAEATPAPETAEEAAV